MHICMYMLYRGIARRGRGVAPPLLGERRGGGGQAATPLAPSQRPRNIYLKHLYIV